MYVTWQEHVAKKTVVNIKNQLCQNIAENGYLKTNKMTNTFGFLVTTSVKTQILQ